jgi:hypothetical protein
MNLFRRLSHRRDMKRADQLIKRARRPHVQSVHLIGYPVERTPDTRLGPRYVVLLIVVLAVVSLINYYKG